MSDMDREAAARWYREHYKKGGGTTQPQSKTPSGLIPNGTTVRLKSGTEGWVKGIIVDYYDVIPASGGVIYGGGVTPGYKVKMLEGKHKGEIIRVPLNYVERI